jgi:hypothetical protein
MIKKQFILRYLKNLPTFGKDDEVLRNFSIIKIVILLQ